MKYAVRQAPSACGNGRLRKFPEIKSVKHNPAGAAKIMRKPTLTISPWVGRSRTRLWELSRIALPGLMTFLVISCASSNGGSRAYYQNFAGTFATDIQGKRHSAADYGGPPPWLHDLVQGIAPEYPYYERATRHQGKGVFRMIIDPKSGSVVTVNVIRSTGFSALDRSAQEAFRRWVWNPGKWKEMDIPVTFVISGNRQIPPGSVKLPAAHSR
jgi:TonB family protein